MLLRVWNSKSRITEQLFTNNTPTISTQYALTMGLKTIPLAFRTTHFTICQQHQKSNLSQETLNTVSLRRGPFIKLQYIDGQPNPDNRSHDETAYLIETLKIKILTMFHLVKSS